MDPGPRSEVFISNVGGILHRFRDVARSAITLAITRKARANSDRAVARLEKCIAGHRPFSLILEDPRGTSDILHKDAVRERQRPGEIAELHAPGW